MADDFKNFEVNWGKALTKKQLEQEMENEERLKKTGFWGKAAAGVLPVAQDSKRFCFALRSNFVEEPNTWALWGGAIDKGETPLKAAIRELKEEAQYRGKILKMYPLAIYKHQSGFKYYSYLALVPQQFKPKMNFETDKYVWTDYDHWPRPLHPKVRMLLNSFKVDSILAEIGIKTQASLITEESLTKRLHNMRKRRGEVCDCGSCEKYDS
jgi:8-oxo-dGTP pyrophosphatase MutT (NUDIX family)